MANQTEVALRSVSVEEQVDSAGALGGLRVLDLTSGLPGSVASMLLVDSGAEVIKVTGPGTVAQDRSSACVTWDRGKRRITATLDDPADVALLKKLAATADVVLAGLRPGVLDALGLGATDVSALNPSIIYCTFSGDRFDATPDLGYTTLAAARLGVMALSPGHRDGPIFPGHPALAYATAMVAIVGVLAALHDRLQTGQGDHLEVTHTDGMLAIMGMNWWSEDNVSIFRARERSGHLDFGRYRQILRIFECADGNLIQVHTGAAGAFDRAITAFGLDDVIPKSTGTNQFATELTDSELDVLKNRLPQIIKSQPADVWVKRLWDHDVACQPLQPPGAVLSSDQVAHAGVLRHLTLPDGEVIEALGSLLTLSDSPTTTSGRVHRVDEDGELIRSHGWLGAGLSVHTPQGDAAEIGSAARLPLEGVSIIDLCSWFAGPYGSRILSDLGASVTKVEPLNGDPIRTMPDPCNGALRGKESLSIDLKDARSRPVMERLIKQADVLQHNLRPGAAERLGLGWDSVRQLNPELIYNYAPGYGATGPMAHLQSFAPLLSGLVGLNHMSGGEGNEPNGFFGNEDYYNGMLSAVGILLALIHRDLTWRGQYVETPQLHSSLLFSSEWHLRDGAIHSTLPTLNHDQTGFDAFHRIYQCLSGWLAVVCESRQQQLRLHDLLRDVSAGRYEPPHAGTVDTTLAAEAMQDVFFSLPAEDWRRRLREAGIPCEVVRETSWFSEFLADERNVEAGMVFDFVHPLHGHVRTIGTTFHYVRHGRAAPARSPLNGEQTRAVLARLGYDGTAIDELVDAYVVHAVEDICSPAKIGLKS